jgi:hypothetical protein
MKRKNLIFRRDGGIYHIFERVQSSDGPAVKDHTFGNRHDARQFFRSLLPDEKRGSDKEVFD